MKKILGIISILFFGIIQLSAQSSNQIFIDDDIQLVNLQDSILIHITWKNLEKWGRTPANGMIIIKNGRAIMIDTPWDDPTTERLTNYLKDSMNVSVTKLISGHYHSDCIGGLKYLQSIGVESIANRITVDKCKELRLPIPSTPFKDSLIFNFNGEQIECRYFGGGHTIDNITVWIPGKKILFGGCLIKSGYAKNLGNISEADIDNYDSTVNKIINKYSDIKIVVPGHGDFGGPELLTHTIDLVKEYKKKNIK